MINFFGWGSIKEGENADKTDLKGFLLIPFMSKI